MLNNQKTGSAEPQQRKSELGDFLESLKDSPIASEDYYYRVMNLCDAVKTIACDILDAVEYAERKDNNEASLRNLRSISGYSCQIISISDALYDQAKHFSDISDIFFYYEREQEELNQSN